MRKKGPMLHHVEIHVSNLAASKAFWRNLLRRVGYRQTSSWGQGFNLSDGADAYLTFVQVEARHAARPYHRCGVGLNHLAFRLPSRAAVDALRAWRRRKKLPLLYDDRYPFATGGTDYYALFVEDPTGSRWSLWRGEIARIGARNGRPQ
ncbi:VOC family protein [Aestuariivirga sp.]|uniref:VOC family protein n=1 Tax=Aestuariivirga sp. TaxID=2650926 RepID=UPI0025C509FC|nr:VOC family protein [Aestuariivirga sp.]